MADWKIARKEGACRACGRSFDEGEAHLSLLVLRGDEPAREDLCQRCFEGRATQGTPGELAGAVGEQVASADQAEDVELWWWRTRWRSEKKRGLALNLEAIEGLFLALEKRAAEGEGATLSELRYILCLVLMRKRRLKIVRIVRDRQGEAMVVRRPRRKESLRVAVHDFTPERTEELRGKLVRLFDGDEADLAGLERDEPFEDEVDEPTESGLEGEAEDDDEPAGTDPDSLDLGGLAGDDLEPHAGDSADGTPGEGRPGAVARP